MRSRLLGVALLIGLALGSGLAEPPASKDKIDPEQIAKLIKQLGSSKFKEREDATKELEKIGLPALPALEKAAKSDDMETRKRAEELVQKLGKEAATAKILAPTKLHLVFKDTPVPDAIAEINKKTGYNIMLVDPQKVADRKVTLDTGETTFWKALDQFCEKAGLVEHDIRVGRPLPRIDPQPVPVKIQPIRNIQIQPVQPKPIKKDEKEEPKKEEPQKEDVKEQPKQEQQKQEELQKKQDEQKKEEQKKEEEQRARQILQLRAQVVVAQAAQAGGGAAAPPTSGAPAPGYYGANQIALTDGKPKNLPTDYAGALRIRAIPADALGLAIGQGEFLLGLQVTPEPKIQLVSLIGVRLDKAVDDQDQNLKQAMAEGQGGGGNVDSSTGRLIGRPVGTAGPGVTPVRLKKGEKEAKTLKELSGTIQVQVRTAPEVFATADEILKAGGKEFKGAEGCTIKIVEIAKADDGKITMKVEVVWPREITPEYGQVNRINLPDPLPVQKDEIKGGGQGGAQPAVQPKFRFPSPYQGLTLKDAKGQPIQVEGVTNVKTANDQKNLTRSYTITYAPEKEQEAAKLTFSGTKLVAIDVPFSLKNVPLK